ncbi:hypothetical protein AVEN_209999-1 [Araneus ventricosus]|uniref:Uncharacterized protein n=1 Tax=Araneus ventricosus TaxID=182803 RepID=A0A4Y2VVQ5_ARAVE|nr:hypothetical protein AVEN_200101-1 [Araneus ventricosus]GBO28324.1 hypothetical protein AVEN_209999-1 [Araneus ventricosus]
MILAGNLILHFLGFSSSANERLRNDVLAVILKSFAQPNHARIGRLVYRCPQLVVRAIGFGDSWQEKQERLSYLTCSVFCLVFNRWRASIIEEEIADASGIKMF